jgi:hypothetical protein
MFHLVNIEKIVRIEPYELGKNLELKIRKKYINNDINLFLGSRKQMSAHALNSMVTSSALSGKEVSDSLNNKFA